MLKSKLQILFVDPFNNGLPTEITVNIGRKVPGAVLPGNSVYAVAQSLAWLAKERRDISGAVADEA